MYGSGAVSCSCSLLIRGPNLARCQAEAPLIALCRFPKPALVAHDFRAVGGDPLLEIGGGIKVQMTGGHERCRGPWTATCQTLVEFVAKHAGTLEPLHDHGQVLAGVVIVVEALSGFVRVEDRDANHC